jgi:hypothetical protein
MRTLLRIFALAPLVLSSVGPATSGAATIGGTPSDAVSSIAGHYRCTASNGTITERSYVVVDGGSLMSGTATSAHTRATGGARSSVDTPSGGVATASVLRTVYGRQENVDTGPSFERIVERSDHSLAIDTPEGTATAPAADASGMRLTGQESGARAVVTSEEAASGGTGAASRLGAQVASVARPLTFSYTLESSGLRRTVRSGSATLSDDRCARTRDVATASCATPNAAATTSYAVVPRSPSGAPAQGSVQMRLVLDDRGRIVGHEVLSSSSPALTSAARFAALDSRYTAAVQSCRAVSSQMVINVQFSPAADRSPLNNGRETNL